MNELAAGLSHQQASELLPWLVNDTLEGLEREGVEAHVASCRDCRAEIERCRALGTLVRSAEVAPSPHPSHLSRLLRRIDEVERASSRPILVRLLGSRRVSLGWALAAQAAMLVVLLGVVFWPDLPAATHLAPADPPARYRALGDPPLVTSATSASRQVRVVFAPTATEADLRRLVLEVHGEMVGGPSPLGAYVVAVPAGGPGAEPMTLVLDHLRADPLVRFAEPVAGGGGD